MSNELPFAGLRVVDFSWVAAGPFAVRFLADYGAEVIVVESGKRSGGLRGQAPIPKGLGGPDVNAFFNCANISKLSITVDLNDPRAQDLMKRLIAVSDVVVDNFRPGIMARWGMGYDDLVKIKPDIIVASMPMVGSRGPFRHWGGFGTTAYSLSGMLDLTGFPDREPLAAAIPFPDNSSNPSHFAVAIIAALRHRRRTGQGQWIDVSQMEATMASIGTELLDASANGRAPQRTGNREGTAAPCGVYRCAGEDDWCAIEVHTDAQWAAFCSAIGRPELTGDPRFLTAGDRWVNRDALDAEVETWTRERDRQAVMQQLQTAGVPAGVVNDMRDILRRDPQLQARGHFFQVEHPVVGHFDTHSHAFRLSGTQPLNRRSPLLGEHNQQVFGGILGLSDAEIEALVAAGVIA